MIAKKKVTTVTLVALVHKEEEGTMKRAERLDAFHENQPHVWRRQSLSLVSSEQRLLWFLSVVY